MANMSFLDIDCNEGYFCNAAVQRGASRAVGIDFQKSSIDFARQQYPNPRIEWSHQTWDNLPHGPFDVILWASAMHYESDPAKIIQAITDRLKPNGKFILECGVVEASTPEMVLVNRHSDSRWYPTEEFLMRQLLAPLAFRRVAGPQTTEGDPVPRSVYHCVRKLPTVLLFRGATHQGKSSAGRQFAPAATKIIQTDLFAWRIAAAEFVHGAAQTFIKENFRPDDLTSMYLGLDSAGLTAAYASLLATAISLSDKAVIIEGFMTDAQAEALTTELSDRAMVWDALPRSSH